MQLLYYDVNKQVVKINLQKKNHFSGFSFYHWAVRLLVSVIIIFYHFLTTCYVLHTSQNITNVVHRIKGFI